ncbi:response regulator [Niabella ginsengisoli]|uniref:Response regulator n=1 Tax=Niabella ginsengisoli TaxID=522298 RepID=A0ABS9SLK0_9BACT|nr:response regulator [Niabella ginsengisoli]MCH5599250.1 response regulator [Niabella ginsengisoli]
MINQKNVLVVDDDPVFKLIARKLFERSGDLFNVVFAENGLDAIELLKNIINTNEAEIPDIILLDIEMPIMNGWGFMEEFIKLPEEKTKNITVYTVSSSIAQEDKNKTASYSQIKAYITKPLTLDIIKDIAEAS